MLVEVPHFDVAVFVVFAAIIIVGNNGFHRVGSFFGMELLVEVDLHIALIARSNTEHHALFSEVFDHLVELIGAIVGTGVVTDAHIDDARLVFALGVLNDVFAGVDESGVAEVVLQATKHEVGFGSHAAIVVAGVAAGRGSSNVSAMVFGCQVGGERCNLAWIRDFLGSVDDTFHTGIAIGILECDVVVVDTGVDDTYHHVFALESVVGGIEGGVNLVNE